MTYFLKTQVLFDKIDKELIRKRGRGKKLRIRYKKWARPELESSKFYRDNPEALKGKWKNEFINTNNPIHLELRMW